MRYKFQILILFLSLGIGNAWGQEEGTAKKFSGTLLLGKGFYLSNLNIPNSPGSNSWTISGEAPKANGISLDNSITNMVGAEFRYFINDKIALKLSGGSIIRKTPAQDNVPGLIDPDSPNVSWIPDFEAVVADNTIDANLNLGGEYHFVNTSKLSPYVGVTLPICYSRWSQYDPTVTEVIDELSKKPKIVVTDVGTRHVEALGFGGQLVVGGDYNLSDNLYFGLEIKPVSYLYAFNSKLAAPGLEKLSADSHTWGFFSQPLIKIGFRF